MNNYTYKDFIKRHTRSNWDWEGFFWLILYIFAGLMTFAAVVIILVCAYQNIKLFNARLEESHTINQEISKLYNSLSNIDQDIITKEQYENRKKIYEAEELEKEKARLKISQTYLSKKKCEIGSYVMIKDIREPVRVTSIDGYIAYTHEGISFVPVETDSWYFLSAQEYATESKRKGREPYFID